MRNDASAVRTNTWLRMTPALHESTREFCAGQQIGPIISPVLTVQEDNLIIKRRR